jgi:hypothetical protein
VLGKVIMIERGDHFLRLDSRLIRPAGRFWASWRPMRRYLRPLLRPWWRLCRRFSARRSAV